MVRSGSIDRPRPTKSLLYDECYRRVHLKFYARFKPLSREIRTTLNDPGRISDEPEG
ncbi:MAG: hypothetical protein P4L36_04900 [Holophaga sp.]|nr:hypothetical protein [Holophaga sp.]